MDFEEVPEKTKKKIIEDAKTMKYCHRDFDKDGWILTCPRYGELGRKHNISSHHVKRTIQEANISYPIRLNRTGSSYQEMCKKIEINKESSTGELIENLPDYLKKYLSGDKMSKF